MDHVHQFPVFNLRITVSALKISCHSRHGHSQTNARKLLHTSDSYSRNDIPIVLACTRRISERYPVLPWQRSRFEPSLIKNKIISFYIPQ